MKKKSLNVLFICLILFLSISLIIRPILAQASTNNKTGYDPLAIDPETGLPKTIEDAQTFVQTFSNQNESRAYLKKGWERILAKNQYFGPIISFYSKISPVTDPISKYTIGMKPNLSWLYLLSLSIFIAIVVYTIRLTTLFKITSPYIYYCIIAAVIIGISLYGLAQKIANFIINQIAIIKIWWVQLILVAVIIVAFFVASALSKSIKQGTEAWEDKEKKEQEKRDREELNEVAGVYRRGLEGLSK